MQNLFPNLQNFFVSASDSVRPVLSGMTIPFTGMFKTSQSAVQTRVKNSMALNRMARDVESSQPSLAAELRYFASR